MKGRDELLYINNDTIGVKCLTSNGVLTEYFTE
jgi:hypothetical protein